MYLFVAMIVGIVIGLATQTNPTYVDKNKK